MVEWNHGEGSSAGTSLFSEAAGLAVGGAESLMITLGRRVETERTKRAEATDNIEPCRLLGRTRSVWVKVISDKEARLAVQELIASVVVR
jgi:hypothetical protein